MLATCRRTMLIALALLCAVSLAVPAGAQVPSPDAPRISGAGGGDDRHDARARAHARRVLARMSLAEKVGQLFWTRAYGASAHDTSFAEQNQTDYGVDTAAQVVEKYKLGGVLYFAWAGNTSHPEQTAALSDGLQDVALADTGIPLSLSIDQEGGIVQRLLEPATVFPGNMALGATRDPALAAAQWSALGEEMRAVGVNANFAPVADVNTNPQNPVIGVRSFGEDPDLVGQLAAIATRELEAQNVSATLKHFPGHGDTEVDSHFGLPIVTYDRETLETVHLAPFAEAIRQRPDAIMTAHIIVEAIDPDLPATLSRDVLTGLLRREMGYDGLIVTDSLGMEALRENWTDAEIPVLAFNAGADVLLNPPDMDTAYNAMLDAVRSGEITRRRLDTSVLRILETKYRRGLFRDPYSAGADVMEHVGTADHLATAEDIGRRAATVVANDAGVLPLAAGDLDDVLVTGWGAGATQTLSDEIAARDITVQREETGAAPSADRIAAVAAAAADHDLVVVTTMTAITFAPSPEQRALVAALLDSGTPVVVVAVRNPYDIASLPGVETYVATYGFQRASMSGAVEVLFGEVAPVGRLPVTIPTADGSGVLYPYGHGLRYFASRETRGGASAEPRLTN
jgi:beta-N-acetylhexosaminidase